MFSSEEKKKIAEGIEKLLLDLNHPEMPKEKPKFKLHVGGKEEWPWANIEPNWIFEIQKNIKINTLNDFPKVKCRHCNEGMEATWCDDEIHTPGMFYECVCGKRYVELDGHILHEVKEE